MCYVRYGRATIEEMKLTKYHFIVYAEVAH